MTIPRLPVARLLLVVVIVVGGVGLMQLVFAVRLQELGQNLESAADKTMTLRTLGLIARYEMIRNRIRSGETIGLLKQEAATNFAASDALSAGDAPQMSWAYELGLGIINVVNVIAGGPQLRARKKTRVELLTEQAYLLELKRDFQAATSVYDQLLAELGSRAGELTGFARLHRGYCLSFLAERRRAADDFHYVIDSSLVNEYRLTAEILLSYLEEFDRIAGEIGSMPASVDKGNAFFNMGAYPKAIEVLEALPAGKKNQQSDYVLGRSYEEIGKSDRALANYRRIIAQSPSSRYARLANRRIYALGSIYSAGGNLVQESEKTAKTLIPDPELIREKAKNQKLAAALSTHRSQAEKSFTSGMVPAAPPTPREPAKKDAHTMPPKTAQHTPRFLPLGRSERKQLIRSNMLVDEITLSDGNRLWGIINAESPNTISMLTVMGILSIDKRQIEKREKISVTSAFKPR